jgi:sn-glycerol 3-phosphate transport system permease protein
MSTRGDHLSAHPLRLYLALLLILVIWFAPFVWMLANSFRPLPEMLSAPLNPLPRTFTTAAYAEVMRSLPAGRYLLNTTVMALTIAAFQILLGLPAAYALAKLNFRHRGGFLTLVVLSLLLPPQVRFVPVFVMFAEIGWVNTMAALTLPFVVSALGIFWFRQVLLSVPSELIEAARLDGAGEARIIFGILAPLLMPTLTAFFIFSFVLHYNDYFWPLVMTTDDSVRTLPLGVALLMEQGTGIRWNVVMAANTLLSLPPLLIFIAAQKQLMRAALSRT